MLWPFHQLILGTWSYFSYCQFCGHYCTGLTTFRKGELQGLTNGARECVTKGPQEEDRMEKVDGTMWGGLGGSRLSAAP